MDRKTKWLSIVLFVLLFYCLPSGEALALSFLEEAELQDAVDTGIPLSSHISCGGYLDCSAGWANVHSDVRAACDRVNDRWQELCECLSVNLGRLCGSRETAWQVAVDQLLWETREHR